MQNQGHVRSGGLTRIERLVRIIKLLSRGKKFTTTQLISALDNRVNRRLIQRDLIDLKEAGVAFLIERGSGNEKIWSIDPKFRTQLRFPLGISEYYSALFLKDALKLLNGTQFEYATAKLINEIDSLLPEHILNEMGETPDFTIFENIERGSIDYSGFSVIIETAISSIVHQKYCLIQYQRGSLDIEEILTIEPRRIVQYDGALYLVAYKRDVASFLPYAFHRIKQLDLQDETFEDSPKFDSQEFRRGRFGVFGADKVEKIELKFDSGVAYHLENRCWDESQEITYDPRGNLILKLEIGITPELVSWILGWGKYCEIIYPRSLRKDLDLYY